MSPQSVGERRSLVSSRITLGLGVVYVAIGVLGFVPGITSNGLLLGIFAVNTVHNIAHLALGAVLIWGGMSASYVIVNKALAVVFAVLVVASFVAPILEQLPLNPPDTILHLASMILTGYIGFVAGSATRRLA
jgi:hypothetical protein